MCSLKCCLVNLYISSNNISRLGKNVFKGFKKLKTLNIKNNNLLVLPDLHWIQHSVYTVDIYRNKIESLGALATSGIYKRLEILNAGYNAIRTFNVSLLRHMPMLRQFGLHGNKLNNIDDFRSLCEGYINLWNNPWHCDVQLSWMGEENMDFEQGLICTTPTCLHGMPITEMSKYVLFYIHFIIITFSCVFL